MLSDLFTYLIYLSIEQKIYETESITYHWVAAAVLLAASCEQEELPGVGADGTQTLAITVTDGGYAPADRDGGSPAGVPQTRAVENGYITKFTAGDACGLYIVRGGELAYANVKLTATAPRTAL